MRAARIVALVIILSSVAQITAQDKPKKPALDLGPLLAKTSLTHKEVEKGTWEVQYRGKQLESITVRVVPAEEGVFFFVRLYNRDALSLSRNLLLKILEMNSEFDYAKLALNEDVLYVRIDSRATSITPADLEHLAEQAALVADEATKTIRDFLP